MKRARHLAGPLALVGALALVGTSSVEVQSDDVWDALDQELAALQKQKGLPGLSVAIVQGGKVDFARGYGLANIETKKPVTSQTVFPIGSIEKEMTAAAVLRLVEEGKISLDAPIAEYLPELHTGGRTVTIRQMLQQVSGLRGFDSAALWREQNGLDPSPTGRAPISGQINAGLGINGDELVSLFDGVPLQCPPGDRWIYSQPNFDLMCLVIARQSGKTYYQAVAELVGKASLQYYPDWSPPPAREAATTAHGYDVGDEAFEPYWEENFGSGWMSASSLACWARALHTGKVISQESYAAMISPVRLNDQRTWGYGMGIGLSRYEGHPMLDHTGNVGGFTTSLTYYPEADLSIAVMCNLGYTLSVVAIKQRVSRILLGIPEPEWQDLPVTVDQRAHFLGKYDAGTFGFEVLEKEGQLYLTFGESFEFDEPGVYVETRLLYQGRGHFVGEMEPEAIWVWFDLPNAPEGEIIATIDGPGWPLQAKRID